MKQRTLLNDIDFIAALHMQDRNHNDMELVAGEGNDAAAPASVRGMRSIKVYVVDSAQLPVHIRPSCTISITMALASPLEQTTPRGKNRRLCVQAE